MNSASRLPDGRPAAHRTTPAALVAAIALLAGYSPRPAAAAPPEQRAILAISGFATAPGGDPRDDWWACAVEETLTRRLQRLPSVIAVPTIRLHQSALELSGPDPQAPDWPRIARALGATHHLTGLCRSTKGEITLDLVFLPLGGGPEQRTTLPAARLFDALDAATQWTVTQLTGQPADPAALPRVFEPPARTLSALEYFAKAVTAGRAGRTREALRYAGQSLDADNRMRAALAMLAQFEVQSGAEGREAARRHLWALNDLARFANDEFDRVRAEIGLCLVLQAEGLFDAAYTRAETAIAIADSIGDVYGEMAGLTAACDSYLLRPNPDAPYLSEAARKRYAKDCLRRAAEWQELLVERLATQRDLVAGLPATNKLALIYERIDQPERALELHQRTVALADQLQSQRHQATAWMYLGQWYRGQERWADALEALNRCVALTDEQTRPVIRMSLAAVYRGMNLNEQALGELEMAHQQLRAEDDLAEQFRCLREIAHMRMQLGRRELAIKALQEALDIAHVLELRDESGLREQLARWQQGES